MFSFCTVHMFPQLMTLKNSRMDTVQKMDDVVKEQDDLWKSLG